MVQSREGASITKRCLVDMQVCVPKEWTNPQVTEYANTRNPTGISSQWKIRKQGHEALEGAPERMQCANDAGKVHIMLEC